MQQKTVIFFGASGAGKGTQAKLLSSKLEELDPENKTLYLETGAKFRDFMETDNFTAEKVKAVLADGGLLPEFLPIWIWGKELVQNFTGKEHLVLDGLSRRVQEAPVLESAIKFYDIENPVVINIEVSEDWATKRLLERGRYDDNEEDIKNRFKWYRESVLPAVDYFRKDDYFNFHDINGEQTIEEVHEDILKIVLG